MNARTTDTGRRHALSVGVFHGSAVRTAVLPQDDA